MNPYALVLDVWEGNLDIDEPVLWQAQVRGLIIRLNSISGTIHKDDNFDAQWAQAERFARAPYVVYDPWVSGKINAEWVLDSLPPGVGRVFEDIEVKCADLPPRKYAEEVEACIDRISRYYPASIYTGEWFKSSLLYWPTCVDYWWARYPYVLYPPQATPISWEEIHRKLEILRWVPACSLGECVLWQCSGDRYKPPGCNGRAVDINVFNGTEDELRAYIGKDESIGDSWEWDVTYSLRDHGYEIRDPVVT